MKAKFHIILGIAAVLLLCGQAWGQNLHVLLYCEAVAPPVVDGQPVTWKQIIPKLDGTVITDYVLLASQGDKRLFYVLFNPADPRFEKVKAWVLANKDSLGLKWWVGGSARDVWKECFKDRTTDAVANTIIRNLIKYPVTVLNAETGQNETRHVPIATAISTYGVTIDWTYYQTAALDAILPHKFFDGSK